MPGRLKQSAARWCYSRISIEDLARQAAEIGLVALDLIDEKDWPTLKKYGLVAAMVTGSGTIPVAWNRKENHDRLEKDMADNITKAAAAKLPACPARIPRFITCAAANSPAQLEAVDAGHNPVQNGELRGVVLLQDAPGILAVLHRHHAVVPLFQPGREGLPK